MDLRNPHLRGPGEVFDESERTPLISRLHILLDEQRIPVETWALLWCSHIDKLRDIVNNFDRSPELRIALRSNAFSSDLIKPWLLKPESSSTPSTPKKSAPDTPKRSAAQSSPTSAGFQIPDTPSKKVRLSEGAAGSETPLLALSDTSESVIRSDSNPVNRKRTLADKALKRDDGCIVTRAGTYTQGAHIYPISMSKYAHPNSLVWDSLKLFWPEEQIKAWQNILNTATKTEILCNIIIMGATVHSAWHGCEFALKPIPESVEHTEAGASSMDVEFYFLKIRRRGRGMVSLREVPDLPGDQRSGRGNLKFADCNTEKIVRSGDTITLTTPDPTNSPLPSLQLLWLQWHLNRVAALCGAAEAIELPIDEGSDGDDSDPMPVGEDSECSFYDSPPSGATSVGAPSPKRPTRIEDPSPLSLDDIS